jgi:hypothetical protein
MRFARAWRLALFAVFVAVASNPAADAVAASDRGRPVKVMTRNLYLGANLNGPVRAALSAPTPGAALVAFGNANAKLWQTVVATNFPARAKLLAAEIDERRPHLIGLQEVAMWRSGPVELPNPNGSLGNFALPNATQVDYDFLAGLLTELRAVGQRYEVVATTIEADVEGPAFLGAPGLPGYTPLDDHRLTMRDVILRRSKGDIDVFGSGTGNYSNAATFSVTLGGRQFKFTRGYNWADVQVKKRAFRFINTHLESELSGYALAQAFELMSGPAQTDQPVVLACDCNSDPLNHTIKPGDTVPHAAPYELITGPFHFTDEWLLVHTAAQGWTSGLSETVDDDDLSDIDHRIDMVFGRRPDGSAIPADRGWITGDSARTPQGLWASDHMGVVMRLHP